MFEMTNARQDSFVAEDSAPSPTLNRALGLIAGTRVATAIGWRPVEAVTPGDKVLTFDAGLQTVTRVERSSLSGGGRCPEHLWPMVVPAGALGNQSEMQLLPEQPVMLESDTAEELLGDPFTLMPAAALEGFRGIYRSRPVGEVEVISICFEHDQVVFANIGALFFCPKVMCGEIRKNLLDMDDDASPYVPLSMEQAETLASLIEADEARDAYV